MLHDACCMLHVACCMLHVACCMLHARTHTDAQLRGTQRMRLDLDEETIERLHGRHARVFKVTPHLLSSRCASRALHL